MQPINTDGPNCEPIKQYIKTIPNNKKKLNTIFMKINLILPKITTGK